jgi:hypothetical protein
MCNFKIKKKKTSYYKNSSDLQFYYKQDHVYIYQDIFKDCII